MFELVSSRIGFVLAALALVTILAVAWGFTMRQDLDDEQDRIAALQAEIDQLRAQANATAYTLSPTAYAPENALGTAFFSLDGTGVITVSNLAQAPEGRSYQVWYYPTDDAEPIPGAVFEIDESTHFCAAAWISTCSFGDMSSELTK